jgi:hypothetical protein
MAMIAPGIPKTTVTMPKAIPYILAGSHCGDWIIPTGVGVATAVSVVRVIVRLSEILNDIAKTGHAIWNTSPGRTSYLEVY